MDARQAALEKKLAKILQEAAEVGAEIQAIEQGPGTPHYDQIESHAHEVGQRLSQLVQQTRAGEVTADHPPDTACPDCGKVCSVKTFKRAVTSQDGPVQQGDCMATYFPKTIFSMY